MNTDLIEIEWLNKLIYTDDLLNDSLTLSSQTFNKIKEWVEKCLF